MRTCTKCGEVKPESEFWKDSHHKDGYFRWCKDCSRQQQKKWKAANPERVKEHATKWRAGEGHQDKASEDAWTINIKRFYGLTPEDYRQLLVSQNGVCAICSQVDTDRRLAIDHCHNSRRVRGLLCMNCNQGLGKFHDDPDRLRRAAEYLETDQQ